MPEAKPNRLIANIPKSRVENIRLQPRSYRGVRSVDVRCYAQSRETGEFVPTGKGVSVKPTGLDDLINALGQAREAARAEGLI